MKAWRGDGSPTPDAINVLDCVECGAWFPTFDLLAKHVLLRHDPLMTKRTTLEREDREDAMAKKRGKASGRIPQSKGGARTPATTAGRIPRSDESQGGKFNPFLKAKDIGKLGSKATLTLTGKVRVQEGQFGTQIIAEAKHNGSVYDWPVKLNTPNHRWLEENLGLNTARWKGKKVRVMVLENLGNAYIAVERK